MERPIFLALSLGIPFLVLCAVLARLALVPNRRNRRKNTEETRPTTETPRGSALE